MMLRYIVLAQVLSFTYARRDMLRGVDVPLYTFAGGQATLSCSYNLSNTRLYSLKWYHNGTEFYRYVPTERNTPINIKPSHKFTVTELFRNDARVTLSLTRLSVSASGQYRCEVIAEHPSFRTETVTAPMTVLKEPLTPPVIVGSREIYDPSELIKIGCQPQRTIDDMHQPNLRWFLNDTEVEPDWVTPYKIDYQKKGTGLSLHVPGNYIAEMGGTMKAECRLTLGPHELNSTKIIKVKLRVVYLENYQVAAGAAWTPSSAVKVLVCKATTAAALLFIFVVA